MAVCRDRWRIWCAALLLLAAAMLPAQTLPGDGAVDDGGADGATSDAATQVELLSGERVLVQRGESFDVSFMVPRSEPDAVELLLPVLPEGMSQPEGPVIVARGRRDMEVRIPMRATVSGRYVIEPIEITTPSTILETPPILVEVRDPRTDRVPFQATWRPLTDGVRQGQSVPVILEITGIDSYVFPEAVSIRAPQTGLFEEVSGVGSVSSRQVAGVELFQIPVAAFIFTPAAAGAVTVPAATIRANGIEAQAAPLTIDVTALPVQAQSTGAVGQFSLSVSVEPQQLAPGETGTLRLEISGVGNLPVLEFPEVTLDGLVEVDRTQRSSVVPDRDGFAGYRGSRELTVRFDAQGDGTRGVVRIAPFAVYDPQLETVQIAPSRVVSVELLQGVDEPSVEQEVPQADLIPVSHLTRPIWVPLSEIPWVYFLFLLGPIVFAIVKLTSVRGAVTLVAVPLLFGAALFPRLDVARLERAAAIDAEGRPAVAGVLYELELQQNEWHAGLHFNRGVLSLRAGNAVDAIFHFRRAVRLAPERSDFRAVLTDVEQYFGMNDQPAIPWYPRPDLFVAALFLVWTLFWVLLAIRGRLRRTIGLVALLMIAAILAGGWWWSARQDATLEAVVVDTVTVRRIPDSTAQPWIQVASATAVTVELSYNEFYLVRTAAGVTGWVPRSALWIQGEH